MSARLRGLLKKEADFAVACSADMSATLNLKNYELLEMI
jgi:hypothetical protein